MLIEWFVALIFVMQPQMPPKLVAPAADKADCFTQVKKLGFENKDFLADNKAILVCLHVENEPV